MKNSNRNLQGLMLEMPKKNVEDVLKEQPAVGMKDDGKGNKVGENSGLAGTVGGVVYSNPQDQMYKVQAEDIESSKMEVSINIKRKIGSSQNNSSGENKDNNTVKRRMDEVPYGKKEMGRSKQREQSLLFESVSNTTSVWSD